MEKSHLVIFERSMNTRFIELAVANNLSYSTLNMENVLEGGFFLGMISRIVNRKHLKNKINTLIDFIIDNNIENVYLSNIEGYIGYSGSRILKRKFPNIKIIVLQHGVFPLEYNMLKNKIIKGINTITFFCIGIGVVGEGFGSLKVGKYIVYGNPEKKYLTNEKKWNPKNIEVNLKFLKSYLIENRKDSLISTNSENHAIMLLQSLSESKLCSEKEEQILINKTIDYLSFKYDKVYVKEHPFCKNRIQNIRLPRNVEIIDDMIEGFYKSKTAYSFFSTALIDAKFFDLKTFAIFSEKIKVKKSIYRVFDTIINFEDEISA